MQPHQHQKPEQWQRRPARSVLVDVLGTLGAAVLFTAAVARGEVEDWLQGEPLEVRFITVGAGLILGGAVLLAVASVLRWSRFRYAVADDGLHTRQGALSSTSSTFAADRIDGVDISEPLLQRLAGLATLTVQVSGGGDSQAEIRGVTRAEAQRLQEVLLAQRDRARADAADQPAPAEAAEEGGENLLLAPGPERARAFVLRSPQLWITGVATVVIAVAAIVLLVSEGWRAAGGPALLAGVAGTGTVRTAFEKWRSVATWQIRSERDQLVVSRGRLNRSSTRIREGKVSAVVLRQGPILRRHGWWTIDVAVSAFGSDVTGEQSKATVCTAATPEEVRLLLPHLLPCASPEVLTGVASAMTMAESPSSWLRPQRHTRWLAPLAWQHIGAELRDRYLVVRSGRWMRDLRVIDRQRIQLVEIEAGPVQRRLDVASLTIHMAPGPTRRSFIQYSDVNEAVRLRDSLAIDAAQAGSETTRTA